MTANYPKTWGEAKAQGWIEVDVTYARGYISRKTDIDNQPIKIASGSRKGELYYEHPCFHSTLYFYRVYVSPAGAAT